MCVLCFLCFVLFVCFLLEKLLRFVYEKRHKLSFDSILFFSFLYEGLWHTATNILKSVKKRRNL